MKYSDTIKVLICKRNPIEMDLVKKYSLVINKDEVEINNFKGIKKMEKNILDVALSNLYSYIIDMEHTRYQSQLYEFEINNPAIKFFVCFQFQNNTYFAIKGIEPLTQIHYKEILEELDKLIQLID